MTAQTSFGRRLGPTQFFILRKNRHRLSKTVPFSCLVPQTVLCRTRMIDWTLPLGSNIAPSPAFFFFSLMQLMSFVAVYIDFAFVAQEKELSDTCVCCMKRCYSLDKRWWSACITALGTARLGLWCADHHLRLGYDSIRHWRKPNRWNCHTSAENCREEITPFQNYRSAYQSQEFDMTKWALWSEGHLALLVDSVFPDCVNTRKTIGDVWSIQQAVTLSLATKKRKWRKKQSFYK